MKSLTHRIYQGARGLVVSDPQIAEDAVLGNIRRLRWLLPLFLALVLLLLAVFAFKPIGTTAQSVTWWQAVMNVYRVAIVWIILMGLAVWRMSSRTHADTGVRVLQFMAPLAFLIFTAVLSILDQWVSPNISPYILGCISVSLLFLLPPATAVGALLCAYVLFFVGLGFTQPDQTQLLSNRANGFGATLLALVISLGMWNRNTRYNLLQRELTVRNQALEKQQAELVWLATRDALTGLFNRGEFMRLAEKELMRTQRHGGNTCIFVIDLDYFKAINDRHGHPAGDKVLVHVANKLGDGIRNTDMVARIGGEEFVVLLPQTDIDAAVALAQKLRRQLRESPAQVSSDLQVPFTASFGVACMPGGHKGSVAALYAAADNALYDAKRAGRDRVARTEPDATLTPSDFQRMRRSG
ncbi:MAG: GGDEF domain-containing protein [Burkholderiaceae bacterium]